MCNIKINFKNKNINIIFSIILNLLVSPLSRLTNVIITLGTLKLNLKFEIHSFQFWIFFFCLKVPCLYNVHNLRFASIVIVICYNKMQINAITAVAICRETEIYYTRLYIFFTLLSHYQLP